MSVSKSVCLDQSVVREVEVFAETEGIVFGSGGTNFSSALSEAARRGMQGISAFDTAELVAEVRRRTGCDRVGFEWGGLRD